MMSMGEPWSQEEHAHFPPAFKAAVRTLLLAHRRDSAAEQLASTMQASSSKAVVGSQANLPAQQPPEVLLGVIRAAAAYPLSP